MDDPRILAAIITSVFSIIVAVLVALSNRRTSKELEKLKYDLSINNAKTLEGMKVEERNRLSELEAINQVLNLIQSVKDGINLFNSLQYRNSVETSNDLKVFRKKIQIMYEAYQASYMELDDASRVLFHEIKNQMLDLMITIDLDLKGSKKKAIKDISLTCDKLNSILNEISIFQGQLLKRYNILRTHFQ